MDVRLLDFMQEHPEIGSYIYIKPPPGEFQKIMKEMERRGIKQTVKRQLKLKMWFNRIFRKM